MNDCLPPKIKEKFRTAEALFIALEKKKNFEIDLLKGEINLFSKKVELNEVLKEKVTIKLKEIGEE